MIPLQMSKASGNFPSWNIRSFTVNSKRQSNFHSLHQLSLSLCLCHISIEFFHTETTWGRKHPAIKLFNLSSFCTGLLTSGTPSAAWGQYFRFSKSMPLSDLLCPVLPHSSSASWLSQKLLPQAVAERGPVRHLAARCSAGPVDCKLVTPCPALKEGQ